MINRFLVYSFVAILGLLTTTGCKSYYHPKETENLSRPISPQVDTEGSATADAVAATIEPYKAQLGEKMQEVLGALPQTLEKARPESRLGNWLADMMQKAAVDLFTDRDIAFSVQNYGGIRVGELAAGQLEVGNLYELMPFDNELVAVELNGFVLQEFLDHMAGSGGWPVSKEVSYRIENEKAVEVLIQGEPIQFNRNYVIAVPDYVANGGSDSKMLMDRQQYKSGQRIRDLLIEYAREDGGPFTAELDGRVGRD